MKFGMKGLFLLSFLFFFLVACSSADNESTNTDKEPEQNEEQNETNEENAEEEENGSNDVSFEVNDTKGPEDQGDLNVWYEGDVEIVGKKITVKGTTNLLPESRVQLLVDSVDGVLFGSGDQTSVEPSGAFELVGNLPDDYEGITTIELSFNVGDQYSEEIKEHYEEGITGDFAQLYYDDFEEVMSQKASFNTTVLIDGSEQSLPIESPTWDIPEDQGEHNIWIEPTIKKEQDYVVLNIKSNLVEEARIRARASIPNYITTGFQGIADINPDGTAVIYIKDPEKDDRIKDMTEYEIVITLEPSVDSHAINVIEAYGEYGEKLEGDLIVDTEQGKKVEQRLTITVE